MTRYKFEIEVSISEDEQNKISEKLNSDKDFHRKLIMLFGWGISASFDINDLKINSYVVKKAEEKTEQDESTEFLEQKNDSESL